jgi:hypothetical protein
MDIKELLCHAADVGHQRIQGVTKPLVKAAIVTAILSSAFAPNNAKANFFDFIKDTASLSNGLHPDNQTLLFQQSKLLSDVGAVNPALVAIINELTQNEGFSISELSRARLFPNNIVLAQRNGGNAQLYGYIPPTPAEQYNSFGKVVALPFNPSVSFKGQVESMSLRLGNPSNPLTSLTSQKPATLENAVEFKDFRHNKKFPVSEAQINSLRAIGVQALESGYKTEDIAHAKVLPSGRIAIIQTPDKNQRIFFQRDDNTIASLPYKKGTDIQKYVDAMNHTSKSQLQVQADDLAFLNNTLSH